VREAADGPWLMKARAASARGQRARSAERNRTARRLVVAWRACDAATAVVSGHRAAGVPDAVRRRPWRNDAGR
jgi:hypothetical protein